MSEPDIEAYVAALLGDDQTRSVEVRGRQLTHEEAESAFSHAGSEAVWIIRLSKGLPDSFLVVVAHDPRQDVRQALAARAALRRLPSVVSKLVSDKSPEVRMALVRNRKVPISALGRLENDEDEDVAWLVKRRLGEGM